MDLTGFISWVVANWPAFLGFVLPPVVTVLKKDIADPRARFGLTLVVCLIAATGEHLDLLLGGHAFDNLGVIFGTFTLLFTESQVIFKLWFNNSLEPKLETMMGVKG